MADTIAVMNQRPDRAARHARRALRAAADGLRRRLPRQSNLLEGTVAGAGAVRLDDGTVVRARTGRPHRRRVAVGVRPEKVSLGEGGGEPALRARSRRAPTSASPPSSSSRRRSGDMTVFHQNAETGGVVPAPGTHVTVSPGAPESTFVVDRRRARRSAHDPAASPGASSCSAVPPAPTLLSLPGLLAACGGGGGGGGGGRGELKDVLNFSNWPLYIDFDEKTKKRPDAGRSSRPRRGSRSTTSRTSTRTPSTSGRSSARSRRASRSTATSSSSPTTRASSG